MMNTMAAVCITALFSLWVWTLKQEISDLHKRLMKVSAGTAPIHESMASEAPSKSGLPTWTLE